MKIIVIGAGAMGCLFGGLLAEHGQDVQLLDVRPDQIRTLNEQGLAIVRDGAERTVKVKAAAPEAGMPADLILIFVKHRHTAAAARTAASLLRDDGVVLTLQNGMGNAEVAAEAVGRERTLCGTTAQGAMQIGLGRIQHSGIGRTVVGPWLPGPVGDRAAEQVAKLLSSAGIAAQAAGEIRPVLWGKLLVNVGINAVTALTGIRNGQLLDLDSTKALVEAAVSEASAVARALSVPAGAASAVASVFAVATATASNRSSMGQDVDAKRPTEIEAINGYVVRKAEELGLAVPVNRTLTALVQAMQAHYQS